MHQPAAAAAAAAPPAYAPVAPAPAHAAAPVVSRGIDSNVQPIASLSPYLGKWLIKARVTAKSEMRSWSNARGEGRLFSIDLLDEHGSEIRATFFREAVDKFFDIIQPDQVYVFGNGKLKVANRKFTSIRNDYEITFDDKAIVECATRRTAIPQATQQRRLDQAHRLQLRADQQARVRRPGLLVHRRRDRRRQAMQ
jgi:replication factor A1